MTGGKRSVASSGNDVGTITAPGGTANTASYIAGLGLAVGRQIVEIAGPGAEQESGAELAVLTAECRRMRGGKNGIRGSSDAGVL